MKKRFLRAKTIFILALLLVLSSCLNNRVAKPESTASGISSYDLKTGEITKKGDKDLIEQTIAIGATADVHGRIYAYDYAIDEVDSDAGYAKVYSAIIEEKKSNPDMILMDVGDTVQDNSAELFNDLDTHPMVQALNYMNFDVWVLGNHEFNFEKSFLDRNVLAFNGAVLSANIKEEMDDSYYAQPYKIFDVNGCRVGVIGILPPHVAEWEASSPSHFKGLRFEPTLASVKKSIEKMEGQYDVLVGAFHIGRTDDRGAEAIVEIAENIQEFSVIFGGHEHSTYVEKVGDVTIIEPGKYGANLARADIKVVKDGDKWLVKGVEAKNIGTKELDENSEITNEFKFVHDKSVADANMVVGEISGDFVDGVDYLTGDYKVTTMPRAQIEDTAVLDLINSVQMYFTEAEVSSAALFNFGSTLIEGVFKKKDVAYIYKYPNTLVGVNITGENLVKYMEWSVSYYNQSVEGDLTISFNPDIRGYNYDVFQGVSYDIDISKPAGQRVENIMFNGKPLDLNRVYKLAVNNYRFGTLTGLGLVTQDDMYYDSYTSLQDAGRIRSLIIKYVEDVKKGVVSPEVDNNWKIVGFDFENPEIQNVIKKALAGELEIPRSEDGRTMNVRSVRASDL
ncbi:bifunctional metallophosphatase/5'-nucleotidase [Thiospirochaeta perfilievii]|uniref:Bifunctional metallophosphatase/5'-nucleotidase n=1 Tax=Thiospirochaeta perfilievii TaxID=252967 RepID=A0A5C1QEH4_9SPIO|nr:5'-nucleotidase C-terminal domain-containing protein [Thiospirochaeta perfilievii]QEN05114.1 bifunctional metallophosphatase/5'-nucleotidase [Thiospirochaeta perfilievii]